MKHFEGKEKAQRVEPERRNGARKMGGRGREENGRTGQEAGSKGGGCLLAL